MLERDLVRKSAINHGHEIAYHDRDGHRTWAEMDERSDRLARVLADLGVAKGMRTAILSSNRIEVAEHWFACLKTGMVRVGINWRYSAADMLHVIRDSDARVILVETENLELLRPHVAELEAEGRRFVGFGGAHPFALDYETLLAAAPRIDGWPPLAADDVAMIGYTSGSTGKPKGVILSHGGIYTMLVFNFIAMGYTRQAVRAYVTNAWGINSNTMCINIVNGMGTVLNNHDARNFHELVEKYQVTQVTLIPTMLRRLIDVVKAGNADVSSLRQVAYGSMPATPALVREAWETLGCALVNAYGASESSGPVVILDNQDHERAFSGEPHLLRSAGRAQPGVDIEIRDEEGNLLPTGQVGLVWMSGETLMKGYLNLPELTADTLKDGRLKTGDFGHVDDEGYLYLGERKHNMIVTGGFNVYPNAVENALAEHPAVSEVAVVGVAHPEWGEAVVAAIAPRASVEIDTADLLDHCRRALARYEVPKHIEVLPALPRGNTDKVDKIAVRRILVEKLDPVWNS